MTIDLSVILTIAERFGIPVVILIGVLYVVWQLAIRMGTFISNDVWAFAKQQIIEERIDARAERSRFIAALESYAVLASEQHERSGKFMDTVMNELRSLSGEHKAMMEGSKRAGLVEK